MTSNSWSLYTLYCYFISLTIHEFCLSVLNNPLFLPALSRLGLSCSVSQQEVNHLFPASSPWGRRCGLQGAPLLFSCAGSGPRLRRLCPCRTHLPGQVGTVSPRPPGGSVSTGNTRDQQGSGGTTVHSGYIFPVNCLFWIECLQVGAGI